MLLLGFLCHRYQTSSLLNTPPTQLAVITTLPTLLAPAAVSAVSRDILPNLVHTTIALCHPLAALMAPLSLPGQCASSSSPRERPQRGSPAARSLLLPCLPPLIPYRPLLVVAFVSPDRARPYSPSIFIEVSTPHPAQLLLVLLFLFSSWLALNPLFQFPHSSLLRSPPRSLPVLSNVGVATRLVPHSWSRHLESG